MPLFRERIGIFRGYGDSQYELLSELLIPYYAHRTPLQGGYLVIGMEDFDGREGGILGRVVRAVPQGDLLAVAGEEYLMDLMRLGKNLPEQVLQSRLRYRVTLRLLGQLFPAYPTDGSVDATASSSAPAAPLQFTPSVRMMPHLGAAVGYPADEVLDLIARGCTSTESDPGQEIGHLAVGDLTFDGSARVRSKNFPVHFRMDALTGRRTAVFARAGMGKSNFVKVLLSRLCQSPGEKSGTLIIDPEGEYAMANASEPGLLDVPWLRDRVVLFTDRSDYDSRYAPFITGGCRVNFSDLSPFDVVANAIPVEKQESVFANLIRGLDKGAWIRLIELLAQKRYKANPLDVGTIVGRAAKRPANPTGEDVSVSAIINNLVPPIQRLHDPKSVLLRETLQALRDGRIVILDISLLGSMDARTLVAWVMNSVFSHNQRHFTGASRPGEPDRAALIPTLCILEEAQFYLGGRDLQEDSPFVRWFKEGRKYKLGSVLVTQQPGAVGAELISQCDNFFVFHLLSQIDLEALGRANMHYTRDIITAIGSEPIPGNCYLWSSRGLSFVTCGRILAFSELVGRAGGSAPGGQSTSSLQQRHALRSESTPTPTHDPDPVVQPNEPVRVPVLKPPSVSDDDQTIVTRVVTDMLRSGTGLAYYEIPELHLAWEDADPATYPPRESLVAVKAYNLRFQVTDALEEVRGKAVSDSTLARILEPFGDRKLVREVLLQTALRSLGCCPERFIGRDTGDDNSPKQTEYFIFIQKPPLPKRKPKRGPKRIDVLP